MLELKNGWIIKLRNQVLLQLQQLLPIERNLLNQMLKNVIGRWIFFCEFFENFSRGNSLLMIFLFTVVSQEFIQNL